MKKIFTRLKGLTDKAKESAGKMKKTVKEKYDTVKQGLDEEVGKSSGKNLTTGNDRFYEKEGKVYKKSVLHKGLDKVEKNPKKAVAVGAGAAGYAAGDEDVDVDDILKRYKDGEKLSESEMKIIRLMRD